MKVTLETPAAAPRFEPFAIRLEIDTEEELRSLHQLANYNITASEAARDMAKAHNLRIAPTEPTNDMLRDIYSITRNRV